MAAAGVQHSKYTPFPGLAKAAPQKCTRCPLTPTCLGRQFVQPGRVDPRKHSRDNLLRNHQRVHTRQPATQALDANTDLVKLHRLLLPISLDDKLRARARAQAHTHTHTHTHAHGTMQRRTCTRGQARTPEWSQTRERLQAHPLHDNTIMGRVQQVVSVTHSHTMS